VRIYIGHDPREQAAFDVAERSLRRHSPGVHVTALRAGRLAQAGLLRRLQDTRGGADAGFRLWDLPSNAPCATEFAISRFLVPMLALEGWALFVDCDVVFMADVAEMFALADPSKAVMVVQHQNGHTAGTKMDGQAQVIYPRKNWSSVVLWNCDHPANRRLSLVDVHERPGRDLHAFYWLADSEIGELPAEWNWLVGVQPRPLVPKLAHYTLGTPDMVEDCPHPEPWLEASRA
jgi:hypothetical protein